VQYTIAKFYRINGGSTQHKGVIPDITFPSAIDPAEWGESKQDNALPWDSIVQAQYKQIGRLDPVISHLEKQHDERIKTEPEFNYVFEDITRYNEEKDRKTISLVEKKRIKEKEENEARALARTNERLKRLGKEPVENLDDVPEVIEKLDPFLEEAALITQDYIRYGRMAKR
jgi:carboxyl-terminal processing protease